jgi:hypothetical protein
MRRRPPRPVRRDRRAPWRLPRRRRRCTGRPREVREDSYQPGGSLKVASVTGRDAMSSRAVRFQATLDPTSQNLTADNDGRLGIVGADVASAQAPIESARAASATFGKRLERYDIDALQRFGMGDPRGGAALERPSIGRAPCLLPPGARHMVAATHRVPFAPLSCFSRGPYRVDVEAVRDACRRGRW